MPTTGTVTYSTSRSKIIGLTMKILGQLGEDESPTASEDTDVGDFLSMLVKSWQAKADFAPGLKMWKRRRGDLYLSNSANSYNLGPSGDNWTEASYSRTLTANAAAAATTLTCSSITNAASGDYIGVELDSGALHWTTINGAPSGSTITITTALPSAAASGAYVFNYTTKAARPVDIEAAVLRDTDGNDVPVSFMNMQDHMALPAKANTTYTGDPLSVYYEAQLTNGVLYLDVGGAADVTKKLHIVWLEPIEDITSAADEPEFPQQWYRPLAWGLAKEVAPMFSAVWTQEMEANYNNALSMAREANPENETRHFQPGND